MPFHFLWCTTWSFLASYTTQVLFQPINISLPPLTWVLTLFANHLAIKTSQWVPAAPLALGAKDNGIQKERNLQFTREKSKKSRCRPYLKFKNKEGHILTWKRKKIKDRDSIQICNSWRGEAYLGMKRWAGASSQRCQLRWTAPNQLQIFFMVPNQFQHCCC